MNARMVFVLVAASQLSLINGFGISWDEPLHGVWGNMFAAFLRTGDNSVIERMPGLGMYYGPSYFLANNFVTAQVEAFTPLGRIAAGHVLNVLTFALTCSLMWALAARMFSRATANLAALMLLAIPPLLAHAQYNPKDVPLMCACSGAMLAGYRFLQDRKPQRAALAGAAFGSALAIKLSAVLIFPVLGSLYALALSADRKSTAWAQEWRHAAVWLAGCAGTLVLLWPTLVAIPDLLPRAFRAFSSPFFPATVLFLGREFDGQALPWYYVPFWLVAWIPVPVVISLATGGLGAVARVVNGVQLREHLLLLGWVLCPLALTAIPGIVRYDSYRQFLFTLPPVAILAARGAEAIARSVPVGTFRQRRACVVGVCVLWALTDARGAFPYAGGYVNPVVRRALGQRLERTLELEYWGTAYKEGVEWLTRQADAGARVCVPVAGHLVGWYRTRADVSYGCGYDSSYVMYIHRLPFMNESLRRLDETPPAFEVRRYGARLLAIYRLPPRTDASRFTSRVTVHD